MMLSTMAHCVAKFGFVGACGLILMQMGCGEKRSPAVPPFSAGELPTSVGGRPAVYLRQVASQDKSQPQILEAQILPGRGMNIYQLRAFLPGKGDIDVLVSPPLDLEASKMNGGPDDFNGNESFRVGGAIL